MRHLFILLALLLLPMHAIAQTRSNAPMLVVGGEQPAAVPEAAPAFTFPDSAITSIAPPAAPAAPTPSAAPAPATPASPPAPASKLWPRDSATIFMRSCVRFHQQAVDPCRCIITQLMEQMAHDEFLKLTDAGTIEQDDRLLTIRKDCVTQPRRRD